MIESELVRRAQSGDRDAFCQLVALHQRRLYALALYLFRGPTDAEDFSQEAWLRAWQALDGYRGDAPFYSWVRSILTSLFLNEQRRRLRHPETACEPAVIELLADNGGAGMPDSLLQREIDAALATLPRQQRLIFSLRHGDGLGYREIAAELGCSAGTVKKALFRAIQKLREKLACTIASTRE